MKQGVVLRRGSEIRLLSNRTAEAAKIALNQDGHRGYRTRGCAMPPRWKAEIQPPANMRHVIADVHDMQHRFSAASQNLLDIIEGVKTGHQDTAMRLSDALGQIQFQDVTSQRVAQVQTALEELNDHLQGMADQLVDKPGTRKPW